MADAIKAAGVIFQTGFFQRGSPVSQFIKREVAAGNLCKITRVRYYNGHQAALDGWFDKNGAGWPTPSSPGAGRCSTWALTRSI